MSFPRRARACRRVRGVGPRRGLSPVRQLFYLAVGLGLLGLVLAHTDLHALWEQTLQIGWVGLALVLLLHVFSFGADALGWHLTLPSVPMELAWLKRLYAVRLIGEAFNYVTPLAGMGGEPVKAVILKKYHGLGYHESGASLLLAKTCNLLGLVVFLAIGLLLAVGDPRVPPLYQSLAATGFFLLALGIILFFLVQRFSLSTHAGHRLTRTRLGHRLGQRLERALASVRDVDERLLRFYAGHGGRFAGSLGAGLAAWIIGTFEVYVALEFLGHDAHLADAWVIEAVAQLVRAATFFIPASIGAEEGAFMVSSAALLGDPVLGVALAVIRRIREIVWILWGLALGWLYSLRPTRADLERKVGR